MLGQGGMGTVWRGQDLLLQRPVAVKKVELPMHLPAVEREALRQRVLREARAAARVSHPRLVTIFDVVEEEGTVFLVQELVDAPTLKDVVTERGPMPPTEVARIGRQLVDGLAAAHANGVVHRDVKPSNVMVREDGSVKLADFGIASVHGDPQLTATGLVIGSPAYMAPEQATGGVITPAADLWSLGATLYFALEGVPPFGRADTLSTLTAVVNEPPRATVNAGGLSPLLDRLLVKDSATRAAHDEVVRLLDAVATPGAPTALTATPTARMADTVTAVNVPAAAETQVVPVARPSVPRRRRGGLGAVTTLVFLLLLGGVALALFLTSKDSGSGPDTALVTDATTPPKEQPKAATSAPTTAKAKAPAVATVPAGWATYRDEKTGYTLAHPAGWQVRPRGESLTDFTDPATGTYLRVDWTDEPGPSAQRAWEEQSASFAKKHEDYREISIAPTSFKGSDNASLWEYSYRSGGAALHAYNLGFVLGDEYGFALNFQTAEGNFAASQQLWEQLKAGFTPPTSD